MEIFKFTKATLKDRKNEEIMSFEPKISLMSATEETPESIRRAERRASIEAKMEELKNKLKTK